MKLRIFVFSIAIGCTNFRSVAAVLAFAVVVVAAAVSRRSLKLVSVKR